MGQSKSFEWDKWLAELTWLDGQTSDMIEMVRRCCDINSGSGNLKGLKQVASILQEEFGPLADIQDQLNLSEWDWIDDFGKHQKLQLGQGLRFRHNFDAERRVLLVIHYDTVYGVEHGFQKCRWLDTGRLNGPGVADAKGGIVVMLYALRALKHLGLGDQIGWEVYLNPDEEIGSPGSIPYFRECASDFDFALLFEPALPDGSLAFERKGSGNFTLVVRGKAAHAGREHHVGRNAVVHLSKLANRIDSLNGSFGESTFNVARVVGGGPANIVPDLAIGRFNVRVDTMQHLNEIEQALADLVAEFSSADGYECELSGGITSPPKTPDQRIHQMRNWVESISGQLGEPVGWNKTGGVCDGNKLFAAGLPNLDTLGPRGGEIHSSREFLDVTSLVPRAKIAAGLMVAHAVGETGLFTDP